MCLLLADGNGFTTQDWGHSLKDVLFLGCFVIAVIIAIIWWVRRG